MLIVGLNGSPNSEGNTSALLKMVLKEAEAKGSEIKVIPVSKIMIKQKQPFCIACSSPCDARCYEGTELADAFEIIKKADALILASPVYFGTVTGQLKAFWDKTRKLRSDKNLINTLGSALSCGAARFGGQETTIKAMYDMMIIQGMIIVGDGYSDDDSGHHGVCAQQPSVEDLNAEARAIVLGKRLVEVAKETNLLRKGSS